MILFGKLRLFPSGHIERVDAILCFENKIWPTYMLFIHIVITNKQVVEL